MKRKNCIVTECIDCRLNNGVCEDTIRITRIELDPASGKITKSISKTKEMYYGSDLHENGSFNTTTKFYDQLGRLVEVSDDGKKFRYEHSTNDSTNLDVKIYDESGKELGFYKRELEKDGSRKTVRYGTNSEEHRITSFYKDLTRIHMLRKAFIAKTEKSKPSMNTTKSTNGMHLSLSFR